MAESVPWMGGRMAGGEETKQVWLGGLCACQRMEFGLHHKAESQRDFKKGRIPSVYIFAFLLLFCVRSYRLGQKAV